MKLFKKDEESTGKHGFSIRVMKQKKLAVIILISSLLGIIILCVVLIGYSQDIERLNSTVEAKDILLNQTNSKLMESQQRISNLTEEKMNLTNRLDSTIDSLNGIVICLNDVRTELRQANESIESLQAELSYAQQGSSYEIHDPTYAEMKLFLEENTVDQNMYEQGYYVCRHFGKDLRNDAMKKGIRCAYIEFYGPRPDNLTSNQSQWRGHVLVGFDTSDKGFIYIEPQNDAEVDIAIGVTYVSIYIEDLLIIW